MGIPASKLHLFSEKHWIGKTDAGHRHSTEEWLQKYASELLAMIPGGGTLVDVGCGAGELTAYLASKFEKVYAMDFSETMLTKARQRIGGCGITNITFASGTAQRLPEVIDKADVILSCGVVQYLTMVEFSQHLQDCRRVLRKGGMVCAAMIPDSALKKMYYRRILVQNGRYAGWLQTWFELRRRHLIAYFKGDLLWDGIGNWFSHTDIARAASEAGFDVEFRNSWFYEYRFHALLTPRSV
jgi:ubiquinone/menaquinone biosynthesis C-methylase UbiE